MKKIKIVRWFLSLCIIFITVILIVQVNGMQTKYTTVSMRLRSEITKKTLCEDIEKEEEAKICKLKDITAFSQNEAIIEGKDMGRKVTLKAYCIYGNVEDVLPVSLVAGNLLIRDDSFGCVLTKKSAFRLFGSIDVVGVRVKINEKTYTIRGIIDANTEAVLYEANLDTDTFNCLELTIDDENGEYYAGLFAQAYMLSPDYTIGGNYLVKALKNICIFPFLIVIFDLTIAFIRKAKEYSKKKGIRYLTVVVALVAVFVVCKLLGYYPERWIPSKWSNFQHYTDISSDIKSQIRTLEFAGPIAKEVALKADIRKILCIFMAVMMGQIYLIRCMNELGNGVAAKIFECLIRIRHKIDHWEQEFKDWRQKNKEKDQNNEEQDEKEQNLTKQEENVN